MSTQIIITGEHANVNIVNIELKQQKTEENASKTIKTSETAEKFSEKMKKKEKFTQKMYLLSKEDETLSGRYERMKNCGKYFDFSVCKDCGHWIIQHATLCRDRLCPICNWRLSLKRFAVMMNIFDKVNLSDYKATFLTLTVKNCEDGELDKTITAMCKAWDRLLHRKYYKSNLKGWSRSIEVTYNKKSKTWHPHIHIIALWSKDTSLKGQQEYIAEDWQDCLRIDYKPIVDNRKIVNKHASEEENNKIIDAVLETSKYSIKDETLDELELSRVKELLYSIKNRRLIAFGGILKKIKTEIEAKIDTTEKEEQEEKRERIEFCTSCKSTSLIQAVARWSFDTQTYNYAVLELN